MKQNPIHKCSSNSRGAQAIGFRVICAWCGLVLKDGSQHAEISHGICPSCALFMQKEAAISFQELRK